MKASCCLLSTLLAATVMPSVRPDPSPFESAIKGMLRSEGRFTFYRRSKGTEDVLYMEVPENLIGAWLMIQATTSQGVANTGTTIYQGENVADLAVQLRPRGDGRMAIVAPSIDNRAPTNPEVQRALVREMTGDVLGDCEVVANNVDRHSVLLDVSNFFRSDFVKLADYVKSSGDRHSLSGSGTHIESVTSLPENAIIRTQFRLSPTAQSKDAAPRTDIESPQGPELGVSFNLSVLPTDNYVPRFGDPRIGYFTVNYRDHSDPTKINQSIRIDPRVNLIKRWRLEKADPKLKLSPPKRPIVFYLDNAIPLTYRPLMRSGVLWWNKAFEEIGFKDVIEVRQMPDDANWDPADIRFNVIRWTVNCPYSVAYWRANPLTGEILNTSLNFDASFTAPFTLVEPFVGSNRAICQLSSGDRSGLAFAAVALDALGMESDVQARMLRDYIPSMVAHEVGHCLGLRHNFRASTLLTPEQLRDVATVETEGIGASIMDYNPINVDAVELPRLHFFSTHIGRYDRWAIRYGYSTFGEADPIAAKPSLQAIASKLGERGHAFDTDEVVDTADPYVQRWDNSSEPLAWEEHAQAVARRTLAKVRTRPVDSGFAYTLRMETLMRWIVEWPLNVYLPYVGGTRLMPIIGTTNQTTKGTVPVSAKLQEQALRDICSTALDETSSLLDARDATRMGASPDLAGNQPSTKERAYPALAKVREIQDKALNGLFDADRLKRIAQNEYLSADTLKMATLFDIVQGSVFREIGNGHPLSVARRDLQARYTDRLAAMVKDATVPNDAKSLAEESLRQLLVQFKRAHEHRSSTIERAHLLHCEAVIKRALRSTD